MSFNEKKGLFNDNKEGKKNPFSVPENYFDQFPLRLQKQLQGEKKIYFSIRWLLKPQVSISVLTALIVLAAVLNYFVWDKNGGEVSVSHNVEELLSEENHLKELASQMSRQEVRIEHVEPIEHDLVIEEIKDAQKIMDITEESLESVAFVQKEEIDYLIDENIDLSLITEELNMN